MLSDEQRKRADEILCDLMSMVREACDEEIERLRLAIEVHQQHSLDLVKDDPRVRLSDADYELWEALND